MWYWKRYVQGSAWYGGSLFFLRLLCFVLSLLLLCAIKMPYSRAESPLFDTKPICFTEPADYAYNDERLSIHIKRYQEADMTYFVCDIQTSDPQALQVALSGDQAYGNYEHTSDIARRHDAVLAINGDDYGTHNYGIIIRNQELIRAKKTTRHMLLLDQSGNFSIIVNRGKERPKDMGQRLLSDEIRQTWEFGPELVRDGQAVAFQSSFDLISQRDTTLEPRTAIGQISPLHYVIIVVDGRREGYSIGASLQTLQAMFLKAGAESAFNMDGGGSTTLYFNGEVINEPSGGKERSVSDILFF